MTTKIVVRLLTVEGHLLGWTSVMAHARGDGRLWTTGPVALVASQSGNSYELSLHWCDVNVETRVPLVERIDAGQQIVIYKESTPIVTVGRMPGPLPAVTVGSVAVAVPVGALGARGR